MILKDIANAIAENHPEVYLIVLLIDDQQRPGRRLQQRADLLHGHLEDLVLRARTFILIAVTIITALAAGQISYENALALAIGANIGTTVTAWLISIFGIGTLLSISGVSISIMISSRVNDPRVAEQLSSLVAIPLIALFMGQSFGVVQFDLTLVLWVTFGMLLLDAVLLYFAIQLFQRETILTRWK